MKKQWAFRSLILTIILLLVLSNPAKKNYVEWVNDKAQHGDEHPTEKLMEQLLLPKNVYEETERKNLGVCSIYKTVGLNNTEMITLAMVNNYVVIYATD